MNLTRTVVFITAIIVFLTLGAHIITNATPDEPQVETPSKSNHVYQYTDVPPEEEPEETPVTPASPDFSGMVGMYKVPSGEMNVWIFPEGEAVILINGQLYDGPLEYIGANTAKMSGGGSTIFFTVINDVLVVTSKPDNTQVRLYRYT